MPRPQAAMSAVTAPVAAPQPRVSRARSCTRASLQAQQPSRRSALVSLLAVAPVLAGAPAALALLPDDEDAEYVLGVPARRRAVCVRACSRANALQPACQGQGGATGQD